jgi:hypothetical protein
MNGDSRALLCAGRSLWICAARDGESSNTVCVRSSPPLARQPASYLYILDSRGLLGSHPDAILDRAPELLDPAQGCLKSSASISTGITSTPLPTASSSPQIRYEGPFTIMDTALKSWGMYNLVL